MFEYSGGNGLVIGSNPRIFQRVHLFIVDTTGGVEIGGDNNPHQIIYDHVAHVNLNLFDVTVIHTPKVIGAGVYRVTLRIMGERVGYNVRELVSTVYKNAVLLPGVGDDITERRESGAWRLKATDYIRLDKGDSLQTMVTKVSGGVIGTLTTEPGSYLWLEYMGSIA